MNMTFEQFNQETTEKQRDILATCCGSTVWINTVLSKIPFKKEKDFFDTILDAWYNTCQEADYLEAFSHHPKIGDLESLQKKYANTAHLASDEQACVLQASNDVLKSLAAHNQNYVDSFGFIFLVCATGKSAEEMNNLLFQRIMNSKQEELNIAKGEQHKITMLRLQKAIELQDPIWTKVSQITTHVLDTSKGVPGKNICIRMKQKADTGFETIAMGITNDDGRVANLLPWGVNLTPGHYQMCFDTEGYFAQNEIKGFYPKVDIDFTVFDNSHYHVPLLINPFGYSTYRGS